MADVIFLEIKEMQSDSDVPARAFYDLLGRPQYGLRYTFVKQIVDYSIIII